MKKLVGYMNIVLIYCMLSRKKSIRASGLFACSLLFNPYGQAKAQPTDGCWKPDTVYVYMTEHPAHFNTRIIYSYNKQGYVLSELVQSMEGHTWINDTKDTYSYDSNNNRLTWLSQYWEDGKWKLVQNSILR